MLEASAFVAIWSYINFFIDAEFYTALAIDSNTYVVWTVFQGEEFRYAHLLRCSWHSLRGWCQIQHARLHWDGTKAGLRGGPNLDYVWSSLYCYLGSAIQECNYFECCRDNDFVHYGLDFSIRHVRPTTHLDVTSEWLHL